MNNTPRSKVDVIIVGAGLIGLSTALALSRLNLSIVVINHGQAPLALLDDHHFSPRVSAISAKSQALLTDLGVWKGIKRLQAYEQMQVWEKESFAKINFHASETGQRQLGHIIENQCLELALRACIDDAFSIMDETSIQAISQTQDGVRLSLENGREIDARLLIGADGAQSMVKRLSAMKEQFWDYDHHAIVANVHCALAHQNIARQAFTPLGPLAFLPLPDPHQVSIVWSQQSQHAQTLMQMEEEAFCQALFVDIDGQLGQLKLATERFSFKLRMRYSQQWLKDRVLLIGDAAHTIHPLAGQGANLGLADVEALMRNMAQAQVEGKGFDDPQFLRRYERARKADAIKTIATMEAFKQGFAGANPAKKLIRGLGLSGVDKLPLLKNFFINQAAGH